MQGKTIFAVMMVGSMAWAAFWTGWFFLIGCALIALSMQYSHRLKGAWILYLIPFGVIATGYEMGLDRKEVGSLVSLFFYGEVFWWLLFEGMRKP